VFRSAISHNACSVACTLAPSRNACCILFLSASHSALELARTSRESSRLRSPVGFGSSPGLAAVVICLKGAFPVFTIANSDRVTHGRQKDLAIPDFSRFCCFQDRLDCWLYALVREHHIDLDLWQ